MAPAPATAAVRPPLLVANWKMNLSYGESIALGRELAAGADRFPTLELWIAGGAPALPALCTAVDGSRIQIGGQNVHYAEKGAFTGEVSVPMLREIGCRFALTGHSERRHLMGESNDLVVQRCVGALKQGFTVILCAGETLDERESGKTLRVLEESVAPVLKQIGAAELQQLVLAYEPVWAIGTGRIAELSQIEEAHSFLAALCKEKDSAGVGTRILYGGSATPENAAQILALESVHGGLIGGASLSAEKFLKLAELLQ